MPSLALLALSIAHATTWTVDPSGSGDATTVAEGVALLSDGDTLSIAPGTYDVVDVQLRVHDIYIAGAGWDSTIFNGSTAGTSSSEVGLWIEGENVTIEGVSFRNYLNWPGADLEGSIALIDCAFVGNQIGARSSYYSASNISFFNTIFADNVAGFLVPNDLDTLRLENSIFVDNERGIWLDGYYDGAHFNQIALVNNTFLGGIIGISIGGGYGDPDLGAYEVNIANNLFSGMQKRWSLGLADYPSASGEIRNNVYSSGMDASAPDEAIPETDNLESDPTFVAWSDDGDWTNDDPHLMAGSPGIDAGAEGYASLTTDADGVTRPIDGDGDGAALPDAGAYEYDPESASADTGASDSGGGADDGATGGSSGSGSTGFSHLGCTTASTHGASGGIALTLLGLLSLRRRKARYNAV